MPITFEASRGSWPEPKPKNIEPSCPSGWRRARRGASPCLVFRAAMASRSGWMGAIPAFSIAASSMQEAK
jgi:hypothetical protein